MNPEIARRIDQKEVWTFRECVGLASEFNSKTRYVIALVHERGKRYEDQEASNQSQPSPSGGE